MLTLTVGNQKGGVGKSTLSVHLAFRAAERGYQVLLVDIDEGDISEVFAEADETDNNDYIKASHLFTGEINGRQPRRVHDRIALIEADINVLDVDDMPLEVIEQPRVSFAKLAANFDLCIIDTPPNLQRRMLSALVASQAVVSPFNISPFSFARMPKLQATIAGVKSKYNPDLEHLGFLPNMVNSKSVNEIEALPELREVYGELIFHEAIIARSCVSTALAQGRAVWHHARSGNQRAAAKEMRLACDAVLARLKFN
ncbi:MAG: ParA family protein [Burkholderiaceae bacterium]|jgi:chromosome partitioning protein|nr:ParA family protein [Burkholderiaceae bacterium]